MNTKMDKPGESPMEPYRDDPLDSLLDRLNDLQNIDSIEELHRLQVLAYELRPILVCKMHFLEQVSLQADFPGVQAMARIELEETRKKSAELHQKMLELRKREGALTQEPS